MYDEDTKCIKKLSAVSKLVLEEGSFIGREPKEKRLGLWNEIRQNKDRFICGECGYVIKDLDRHFRSIFDASLLCLSCTFIENDEDVSSAREMFTPEEQETFGFIERYRSIEIYSESELKTKLIHKDKSVLDLFRQYFLFGDNKVDNLFESPNIRNSLKFYFNKKWGELKRQINKAATSLITEVDYLGLLVRYWEDESKRIADVSGSNARQRILAEVKSRELNLFDQLSQKEDEIRFYLAKAATQEEQIRSYFAGTDKNSDENSRYVTLGEVKQYELNFIERMNQKFSGGLSLNSKKFVVKERLEENSSYAEGIRASSSLNASDYHNLPLNRRLKVRLAEKKLFARKSECVVFASFISRPDVLAKKAFDDEPLGLREINMVLDEMLRYAKQNGVKVLLCLASPTGFDRKTLSYIDSDTFFRNFSSQYLSACLLDLELNEVCFNRNDAAAGELAYICNPELPFERIERVKQDVYAAVDDQLSENSWAELNSVFDKCSEDSVIVKRSFYQFADDNNYTVRFVPDVGLVLMK